MDKLLDTPMDTRLDPRLHEPVSALADGELALGDIELVTAMLATTDGQRAWKAYYQIGAALRSQHCGAELSANFTSRLAARLALENDGHSDSNGDEPVMQGNTISLP